MTSQTLSAQETNKAVNISTQPQLTHNLVYRGSTYLTSLQRINKVDRQETRLSELVGKRLVYRARAYEVMPNFRVKTEVPSTFKRLIYRGTVYLKAA